MAATGAVKRLVRGPAKAVRSGLFPEYEAVLRDLRLAFESVDAAHRGIADLQEENRVLRARVDELVARLDEALPRLDQGLLEERRLNLRIAELTDVVTEIVLPLHDRDIDPEQLRRLAADTL
jgi:hypothetical protein